MFFLSLFEFAVCVTVMILIVTQMLVPSLKGTKMFPMFQKEQKIQSEIRELNQESSEVDLEKEAREIRKTIKTKRRS